MQTKRIGYRIKYTKKIIPRSKKHTILTLKKRQKITKGEIYGGGNSAKNKTRVKKQSKEVKKNNTPTREERQTRSKLELERQKNITIQTENEGVPKEVSSEESTRTAASDVADKEREVEQEEANRKAVAVKEQEQEEANRKAVAVKEREVEQEEANRKAVAVKEQEQANRKAAAVKEQEEANRKAVAVKEQEEAKRKAAAVKEQEQEQEQEEANRKAAAVKEQEQEEANRNAVAATADKEKSDATKVDIRNTKEDANDDKTYCPSRNLTPRIPKGDSLSAKKKDYRKQSLVFSPDKNIGCVKQSTDKVVVLNKYWEDIQNEEDKGTEINASIPTPMLMSNTVESNASIDTLPQHKDEQPIEGNLFDIASFGIDIRYPNGIKESPIVNLIGNSGGTTDAVLSAMEIQSKQSKKIPDINNDKSTSPAIESKGGKLRRGKKLQKTQKPKKIYNKSMKRKKVKL